MIYQNIIETIGNTPIVKIHGFNEDKRGEVYGKIEYFNPGGSVKDRIAAYILDEMEKNAEIKSGDCIVEPTSGNTGIGIAMVCAAKGYDCMFVMPESMSMERKKILSAYGAKLVLTPANEGMQGSIRKAEEIAGKPGYCMLRQFENPLNPEAHYEQTSREIINDFENLDALIAGVGTGGTVSGIGKRLKEQYQKIEIIAVEPQNSAVLSGKAAGPHKIQGIGAGFVPKTMDMTIVDTVMPVGDYDAQKTAQECSKSNGIMLGFSGGAALWSALKIAGIKGKNSKTLFIVPDNGERYLSTDLYPFDEK